MGSSLSGNRVAVVEAGTYLADNLAAGSDSVGGTSVFQNLSDYYDNAQLVLDDPSLGMVGYFLAPNNTGYLGLKFTQGTDVYFGWMQVRIDGFDAESEGRDPSITLIDWAYENTAGKPIVVGTVPEPSAWILGAVGGLALLRRRR
ncbi:MAG: PEP-CTERM sorting domain-containing protein [Luteolibacter sp.]